MKTFISLLTLFGLIASIILIVGIIVGYVKDKMKKPTGTKTIKRYTGPDKSTFCPFARIYADENYCCSNCRCALEIKTPEGEPDGYLCGLVYKF